MLTSILTVFIDYLFFPFLAVLLLVHAGQRFMEKRQNAVYITIGEDTLAFEAYNEKKEETKRGRVTRYIDTISSLLIAVSLLLTQAAAILAVHFYVSDTLIIITAIILIVDFIMRIVPAFDLAY